MNLQFYIEKLHGSEEYSKFKKDNPKAFLASGFFCVDKQGENDQQHLDYYNPENEKVYSFKLENSLEPKEAEEHQKFKQEEGISEKLDIDFDEIEELILDRMEKEGIKNNVHKYLFSLQKKDKKDYVVATVFISKMGLIKASIDIEKQEIEGFEKKSLMDMIKFYNNKEDKKDDSGEEQKTENSSKTE